MKNLQHHYLHFTKRERRGTIAILSVVMILILMPLVYPYFFKTEPLPATDYKKEIAALDALKDSSEEDRFEYKNRNNGNGYPNKKYDKENLSGELFYFDPNSSTVEDWKKLGVKEKTATGIRHYIEKGGQFRQPADIKKIWGLSASMVDRLLPYIRIRSVENKQQSNSNLHAPFEKKVFEKKIPQVIDINEADTTAYITLPGIGSKLAARIVLFREKLGGFYAVGQVAETFGLADSVFERIKPYLKINGERIKKININTASIDELKQHPYIRWQLAKVITEYRSRHGDFSSVADIKKIMLVTEETFMKLQPYLSVE